MTDLARQPKAGEDEQIALARQGDVRAFEALYRAHVGRVYGLCLRMAGEPQAAEDLTQDTFVNAWRSLPGYEGRSSLATWLHRIAVNAVLAKRRSPVGRNEISLTDDSGEQMEFAAEQDLDEATPIDLERAIVALPPGARDIVVLHGIYGYSHEEAATMLGLAVGTCKAQLHRARQLMRGRDEAPRQGKSFGWPMALAAGVVAAAVSALLTWGLMREPAPATGPLAGTVAAQPEFVPVNYGSNSAIGAEQLAARDALLVQFRQSLERLSPKTREAVVANLAVIQRAADEIDAALAQDPASGLLNQLLVGAYQQELQLYSKVVTTGGDITRRT